MAIFFLSCQPNCSIISICLETVLIIHFSFLFGKRHLWFSQPNKYNWEARSFHVIFMEFETPGVDIKTDLLQGIRMIIFSVFCIGWLKWKHVYCIQERNPTVSCKTTPRTIFGSSMQTQDVSFASLWLVFCWNALSPRDQYKTNKKKKKVAQERAVKPLPEYMSRCWFLESVRIPVSAAAEDSFSFCFTLILHWESTTTTNYHTPTPKYRMHLNFLKLHPYFCHLSCPRVFSLCLIPSNQWWMERCRETMWVEKERGKYF